MLLLLKFIQEAIIGHFNFNDSAEYGFYCQEIITKANSSLLIGTVIVEIFQSKVSTRVKIAGTIQAIEDR
jgi:hypothetical protein